MTYIAFERRLKTKFNASVPNCMAQVQSKLDRISNAIDQLEDHSYQFNVKLIGVPEMSTTESASSTSSPCVKIFIEMGADVSILVIDTAHRVPTRTDRGSGPKPITCKFVKRLAKEQVMEGRNDVINVNPTAIPEQTSMSAVRILDHLTSKMQLQIVLYEAKRFKNQHHYQNCWAKNSVVHLRKDGTARPIKIKCLEVLQRLSNQS